MKRSREITSRTFLLATTRTMFYILSPIVPTPIGGLDRFPSSLTDRT